VSDPVVRTVALEAAGKQTSKQNVGKLLTSKELGHELVDKTITLDEPSCQLRLDSLQTKEI
jgi:hypothetical protein